MGKNNSTKRFSKKWILIILLFIFPPLGVVGIIFRDMKIWKKVIYIFFSLISSFLLLVIIVTLIFPENYYHTGRRLYEKERYEDAILAFEMVPKSSENYAKSRAKIDMATFKIDSIRNRKSIAINKVREDSILTMKELTKFQKIWADSIFASENTPPNQHFVSLKYALPDTIVFEYTENITIHGYNNNLKVDTMVYRDNYRNYITEKLNSKISSYPVYITFSPNQNIVEKSNPSEWKRPVLMNAGLKIYTGNRFSKQYLGTLNCKFKNTQNGLNYFVVLESSGSTIMIEEYKFRNQYWVKDKDHKSKIGIGLDKCY